MQNTLLFLDTFNVFFILLLLILAIYLWYAFCIIYHLIRFGIGTKPKILALIFFIGSFLLFTIAINAYSQVNWKEILQQIFNPPIIYQI